MILVDSSVWIDHLRVTDFTLSHYCEIGMVATHPFVIGELSLGSLRNRAGVLGALKELPQVSVARDEEVVRLIERYGLFGLGIGYIDAHLLAAVCLTPGSRLWTRDKRLLAAAERAAADILSE